MNRIKLFGIEIDNVRMGEAVERLNTWVREASGKCRYVVTPNVDHTVLLQESEALRASYRDASLVLADGLPVVLASHLVKRPLSERVTGSDLVPALFNSCSNAEKPLRVFLLGAAPGVAERAKQKIESRWKNVQVVDLDSPPLGFEKDEAENERILARIAAAKPDVLIVGFGAPKQEAWVHRFQHRIAASAALCVGATIDFLAGEKRRAPKWIRSLGLEWFHRMASEPKRLIKRYARDAWIFPRLVWRELSLTR